MNCNNAVNRHILNYRVIISTLFILFLLNILAVTGNKRDYAEYIYFVSDVRGFINTEKLSHFSKKVMQIVTTNSPLQFALKVTSLVHPKSPPILFPQACIKIGHLC